MARRGRLLRFPAPPPATIEAGLVEIYRCDQAEALVVKSLLDSDGIPVLLKSRLAHSVHPFSIGTQGEVVILVHARDAARASRLLVRLVS